MERTVLIIDNDAAVREMMEVVLRREGFQTVGSVHGPEALKMIDDPQADSYAALIVQANATRSQLDSAERTGIALLKYLQQERPHLLRRTVVVTTMQNLTESFGCSVVLQPFEISELLEAVRRCADAATPVEG